MGKKKKRKKGKVVLIRPIIVEKETFTNCSTLEELREQINLNPYRSIGPSNYLVYKIESKGKKTIGYMGFFPSGMFNYVIIDPENDFIEALLLLFIKDFIKSHGLIPTLNPVMTEYKTYN